MNRQTFVENTKVIYGSEPKNYTGATGNSDYVSLKNYDRAGATKDQPAYATAIQGVLNAGYLRLSATGILRDLNYVVRNVPGFIPRPTPWRPAAAAEATGDEGGFSPTLYMKHGEWKAGLTYVLVLAWLYWRIRQGL